jgi:hypothetical protein
MQTNNRHSMHANEDLSGTSSWQLAQRPFHSSLLDTMPSSQPANSSLFKPAMPYQPSLRPSPLSSPNEPSTTDYVRSHRTPSPRNSDESKRKETHSRVEQAPTVPPFRAWSWRRTRRGCRRARSWWARSRWGRLGASLLDVSGGLERGRERDGAGWQGDVPLAIGAAKAAATKRAMAARVNFMFAVGVVV